MVSPKQRRFSVTPGPMRARRLALAVAIFACGSLAAEAAHVSRINVEANLDNDGRLRVVETHQMKFGKGAETEFRVFGRSVDQEIVLKAITRIDPDGTEHPLENRVDREVEGPDQFRYYSRGHVYFRFATVVDEQVEVSYRFEYEVVNAVSPAWALAAGPEPLVPEAEFPSPIRRFKGIIADIKEARPDPKKRYRFDHSVLFPDRGVWNGEALEINYRIEYGTAWRMVNPDAELAQVTPSVEYRVRQLFEYLPQGQPAAAAREEVMTRIESAAVVLGLGLASFLLMLLVEAFALSGSKRLDPNFVAECLAALAPEEVEAKFRQTEPPVTMEGLLSRLASEHKIAIEFPEAKGSDGYVESRLRPLVPRESLPPFEREFIDPFFEDGQEVATRAEVRKTKTWNCDRDHPHRRLQSLIEAAVPETGAVSLLSLPALAIGLWGGFRQVQSVLTVDAVLIFVVLANLAAFVVTLGWPKGWWHGDRPRRGLLILLILLSTLFTALHLGVNCPLAAEAWTGSAITIVAYHVAQLINSRVPSRGPAKVIRDLIRIRRYAKSELRQPAPRLDDKWVPHLAALGLGPQIEHWRQEFGSATVRPFSSGFDELPNRFGAARFTGQLPEPFVGPPGWADAFFVVAEDDDETDSE